MILLLAASVVARMATAQLPDVSTGCVKAYADAIECPENITSDNTQQAVDQAKPASIFRYVLYGTFTWKPDVVIMGTMDNQASCETIKDSLFKNIPSTTLLHCDGAIDFGDQAQGTPQ